MSKYSIIVPVYNTKKYLNQCVNSILAQSFRDFEIILVDDGSKDGSGELCDLLAQKYENVRAIHQKNAGASVARNNGILSTDSEFVIFLDSDDYWCEEDGLRIIDEYANDDIDIICFASKTYDEFKGVLTDDRYEYPNEMNHFSPQDTLEYMVTHDRLNFHAGKRAYRREFLLKNDLLFKPNIRTEDVELSYRVVNCLPTYKFINEKIYVYREREGSVTHTIDYIHLKEFAEIICDCAEFNYINERVKELMLSYTAYQYAIFLARISDRKEPESKELCKKMKKYTYLFHYRDYPRTKMVARFYKLFGFELTKTALRYYLKKR